MACFSCAYRRRNPREFSHGVTAGILIIGSLFWDSENQRPVWRTDRLNMAAALHVTAPIRYGRVSRSRANSYTMVLSGSCPLGQAKLVPCSRWVSTVDDLVAEAKCLWKAEQPAAQPDRIASSWGSVAVLCNPIRNIPPDLLKGWASCVAREPGYSRLRPALEEGALINEQGLLQIDWPRSTTDGREVEMDLVLATATKPTLNGTSPAYPSAAAVAAAFHAAGTHAGYFWNNHKSGITTFQDEDIEAAMHPRDPVDLDFG